jgi:radical SAM superfamily enzyme YgiQ (UPF0313 family)
MHHTLLLTGLDINNYGQASAIQRSAGAHRIATFLRMHGWDAEVIDFLVFWTLDELKELCKQRIDSKTVFVGFSSTFSLFRPHFNDLVKWIKEKYPHVKIVAGGPIAGTSMVNADYYVEGFGENAILALVRHLLGTSTETLKYRLWQGNKKLIKANLDYPSYPMGSLKIKYEDRDFIDRNETLTTELARGCKFHCDFCYFPILGVKGDYSRDAEDFKIEMLDTYDRFGVTSYMLADETINDRTEKLEKFANVVNQLPFEPYYRGFLRADLLVSRPQDIEHIKNMKLWGHHYGIESLNYQSVKSMGKGMHPDKLMPGLLKVKEELSTAGPYLGTMSLIVGLPYETKETIEEGFNWIKQNWNDGSVIIFPLYIPKKHSGDSESKLTDKWSEWNYTELTDLEQDSLKLVFPAEVNEYLEKPWTERGVCWQNEHMNLFDSIKITNDFYSTYNYWGKPLIWSVGDYKLANGYSESEIVKKTMREMRPKTTMKILAEFVNQYKIKKLSVR